MLSKICSKCKQDKSLKDFNKNKTSKDGYQNQCNSCMKQCHSKKPQVSKQDAENFVKDLVRVGKTFICKCCSTSKQADEFYYQRKLGRVKINDSRCKECQKSYQRLKTFGISESDFEELLKSQNNQCSICKIDYNEYLKTSHRGKRFAVDHDHKTGEIRGLLCDKCNRGIGFLQDSVKNLENAIKYLRG